MKVAITKSFWQMSALSIICMIRDILTFRALETHRVEDDLHQRSYTA